MTTDPKLTAAAQPDTSGWETRTVGPAPSLPGGELRERLQQRAAAYTDLLRQNDWKPSRAHMESARNELLDGVASLTSSEARAEALQAEVGRLREALLHRVRRENGCPPDGLGQACDGWLAEKCGCADEARSALSPTQERDEP